MSIPAILGALVLELKDATDLAVSGTEVVYYVIGMAVAAVVGYVCIKTMLVIVRKEVHRFCHLLSARWRIVHRRVFLSGITVLEVSKFWQQGIKRVHLGNERHRQAGRKYRTEEKDGCTAAGGFTREVILWIIVAVSILLFISNFGIRGTISNAVSRFFLASWD